MENRPKTLTANAFLTIRSEENKSKHTVVVQVTESSKAPAHASLILSDGVIKDKVVPYKNIKNRLEDAHLPDNSIIEAEIVFHKGALLILLNYKPIYVQAGNPLIGNPIHYGEYTDNGGTPAEGAHTAIPRTIWDPTGGQANKANNGQGGAANRGSGATRTSRGPVRQKNNSGGYEDDDFTPISLLNGKTQSYVLRARLTRCPPPRNFNGKKGPGKVQNLIIMDKSGKIQLTLWTEQVDKFASILREGAVYVITGADIRHASKYNKTGKKWELVGSKVTQITEADEANSGAVPTKKFNLVKISDIASKAAYAVVDILGIVASDKPDVTQISIKKTGELKDKTEITIADESNAKINAVVWGDNSKLTALTRGQLVIFEGVSVREFKGSKNLSFGYETRVYTEIPDDVERRNELIMWRNKWNAGDAEVNNLSEWTSTASNSVVKSLKQIKEEAERGILMQSVDRMYFSAIVNVTGFTRRLTWTSTQDNKEIFLGTIKVCDHSHEMFIGLAGDQAGKAIVAKEAEDIKLLKDGGEESEKELRQYLNTRKYKEYYVRIGTKLNTYNGEDRVNYTIHSAYPTTVPEAFKKQNAILLRTLKRYLGVN